MTGWFLSPIWAACISLTPVESQRYFSVTSADSGSCCHQSSADHKLLHEQESILRPNIKFMKQMYLPLKFAMAFKTAPHRPGLKINITLMTPCNCLLNSSDKPSEWTEALNSVSLSLQWQLLCRDWKTCFSLSFWRKPFYPYIFTHFFFAWTWVTQSFLPSGLNWWQCRS